MFHVHIPNTHKYFFVGNPSQSPPPALRRGLGPLIDVCLQDPGNMDALQAEYHAFLPPRGDGVPPCPRRNPDPPPPDLGRWGRCRLRSRIHITHNQHASFFVPRVSGP